LQKDTFARVFLSEVGFFSAESEDYFCGS